MPSYCSPKIIDKLTYERFCSVLPSLAVRQLNDAEATVAEKFLIVGMRRDLRDILASMNEIAHPGTEIHLFNQLSLEDRMAAMQAEDNFSPELLRNLSLVHTVGNPISR